VAEDSGHSLEQIGFAATVFADEYIDKTVTVEAQGKIAQVLIMTDAERYQAHTLCSGSSREAYHSASSFAV
jgi:hypothetical protein